MHRRSERGQVAAEYLGLLVIVAAIIAALAVSPLGRTITDGARSAICRITGAACAAAAPAARDDQAALARRERVLAPLAQRGQGYASVIDRARAARMRGDLAGADRLLTVAESYASLTRRDRSDIVDAVDAPSDAQFGALVDRKTIDGGGSNRRYFQIPPAPGQGLVVQDFFIPTKSSGGVLRGDGRDTEDPLLGPHGLDGSRVVIVLDRESGRGVITQSRTCTGGIVPKQYCLDPRPIELREPRTRPQALPSSANEFAIHSGGDGSIEIRYDALNSITPLGLSVDGTVRYVPGPDGTLRKVSDSRDPYPRIVTGQYAPGRAPRIVDATKDEPVLPGALPGPARKVIEKGGEVVGTGRRILCDVPDFVPITPLFPDPRELVC